MTTQGPRHPDVLKLLKGLDAETELVTRLALSGLCPRCRGDRAWRQRIEDLRGVVARSAPAMARVLRRSGEVQVTIAVALEQIAAE